MRVLAHRMAFSPRAAGAASLLAIVSLLGACAGLIKKTADACSVSVAPIDVTVPVNASTTVVGTAFDCSGNSIPNRPVTFSSANSSIASVTVNGTIIGIAVGTTKVTASASGKSAYVTVTVSTERVATMTVTPASVTLRRTNTRAFTAVAKNASGVVINGATVTWASSNSSVAFVDNTGQVTALAVGTVTITATADGQTGASLVTVTEVPIGSIALTPATQNLLVGNQSVITAALKDTAGNALSSTGRSLSWSSNNEVFATVSQSGTVTGIKAGTVTITATNPDNTAINSTATVVVTNPVINNVQILPVGGIVRLGIPKQYSVSLTDINGTNIPVKDRTISWTSVTPSIASVSSAGVVTALQTGTARVAVNAEGKVDTATFSVQKIPVANIVVAPLSFTLQVTQTKQFTTTVTDSVGNIVTDRTIQWTSSDNNKAVVDLNTGLATAVGAGSATITANSEGRSGSATLNVTLAAVDTIQVVTNTFTLKKGSSSPFSITLRDASGNQLRNRSVVVTSDQPSIATGAASADATTVTVNGVTVGTATLTIQAVDANNNNQGRATMVIVTVTAASP
jgi:uncharacterized protein YjdB